MIKKFFITATAILMVFCAFSLVFSQDLEGTIQVFSPTEPKYRVTFLIKNEALIGKNISFLNSYADAEELGERISRLSLYDTEKSKSVPHKKFAAGEYVAEGKYNSISYTIDLKKLKNTSANAHVSWIGENHGLLMLRDVLPRFQVKNVSVKIGFQLPSEWRIKPDSNSVLWIDKRELMTSYSFPGKSLIIKNPDDAVLLVGKNWREKEITVSEAKINFLILNQWQFSDELAFEMAEEIIKEYVDLFGEMPVKNAQIVLADFPEKMDFGRWRAETRGANVTILSSKALAESFARQRLHEQLRHEIFHLWIPNALNLEGDYAWFYEGFAVYQALKTGVNLGQIRFEDFLNTLEQAYFLDQKRSNNNSLIDISQMRWNGEVSSVYAKGMLVAFLCDAAILEKSKGKRDVKDIFREIYRKHSKSKIKLLHRNPQKSEESNVKLNANEVILKVLEENDELVPIIIKYIKGKEKIDWAKYLAVFGIENIGSKTNANLMLKSKLSGRQKALLEKLGYNKRRNFKRRRINKNQ